MKTLRKALLIVAAPLFVLNTASAQGAYPDRPIKIVVPFAPGGIADSTARLIASELSNNLGQPVIVENRPGGAAIIGTQLVAKAPGDGYTLLMATTNVSTNPALYKKLPYDADKDLIPVALAVTIPGAIVVPPSLPVKNFNELVSYAKQNPEKISYASVGLGSFSHLAVEGMAQRTSTKMVHIPYKGYAPAITSVLSDETHLLASDVQGALPYLRTGRLKALAVTGVKRVAVLPEVPTLHELGIKDYQAVGWLGLMAPAGTPAQIISLLNSEVNKVMRKPAAVQRYTEQGVDVFSGDPSAFRKFLDENRVGWEKVIKTANISLD
ncbi:Bug family tripartite tricarboxylate transporter substrate binding protein [Noviherbaspirillum malthae]|uniref:Bug family tripartite tricarboxylate transporter substrate binding protein n=1 Tax=Noviherbaspirillum malthae TaxID=1260987 RepID=UPI00188E02EF|nr:tripartite tricarboxylate transporter substrate binding protein [Noviherbaspirillum malthae]